MIEKQYESRKKGKCQGIPQSSQTEFAFTKNNVSYSLKSECCVASCGQWSVIVSFIPIQGECFLRSPTSPRKIHLPRLSVDAYSSFSKCILSASPTDPQCIVFFFHKETPKLSYCIVGKAQSNWTCWQYASRDENIFSEAVSCNGRIYVLHRSGLHELLIQLEETRCRLYFHYWEEPKILEVAEEEYLVDSCREVFLVRILKTSRVEVFKRNFSCNQWVMIQSLGDQVFFLSCHYSLSLSATELGMEGNRIYFTRDDKKSLYVFNFGNRSLSVLRNRPNSEALWLSHDDGLKPVLRLNKNRICLKKDFKKVRKVPSDVSKRKRERVRKVADEEDDKSIFSILPIDLQKSIAQRVSVGRDYMNFRVVCRKWRSLAPPLRWRCISSATSSSTTIPYPWLIFFQEGKGAFHFWDPRENITYHMNVTKLPPDCVIRCAKEGWLVISQGARSMFLYEPFTEKRILLPDLPEDYCLQGICIYSSPLSSDCIIVGRSHGTTYDIHFYFVCPTPAWESWICCQRFHDRGPFCPPWSNPVLWRGYFSYLDQNGSFGRFELGRRGYLWHSCMKYPHLVFPSTVSRHFLVSFNKDLLAIFVGNLGTWVHVYKLDYNLAKWVRLSSLGDCALFLSETTSLAVIPKEESMKNKIYFPIFSKSNGNIMFYSLETCMFHTSDDDVGVDLTRDLYDTRELLNCTWIQPGLVPTF